MLKYAAFALLVAVIGMSEAKMQNVTVKGTVVCDKRRMGSVLVQLMEKDTVDADDILAQMNTTVNGEFFLKGGENEITSIAPYIRFHHNCKASIKPGKKCVRQTDYIVPKSFIDAPNAYDMTYVILDTFVKDEKEKCEKIKN